MNELEKIKHYNSRMATAINELEQLETQEWDNYNDIVFELRHTTQLLENRRELLQKRGARQ